MAVSPTVIRYMWVENTETILRDAGKCMRIEVDRLRLYVFLMQLAYERDHTPVSPANFIVGTSMGAPVSL